MTAARAGRAVPDPYRILFPIGVAAGWAINRLLPQRYFDVAVQIMLFVTSLHLIVTSWPT